MTSCPHRAEIHIPKINLIISIYQKFDAVLSANSPAVNVDTIPRKNNVEDVRFRKPRLTSDDDRQVGKA